MRSAPIALCLTLCLSSLLPAQSPQTKTDPALDAEASKANDLYHQSKALATLPLYEDLHAQRPASLVYTERLAMAYIAKSGADASPADQIADRNTARRLFNEAHAAGDNSDLMQVMLEKFTQLDASPATPAPIAANDPRAPGGEFAKAEQLFSQGNLAAAIDHYGRSWQAFPTLYSAPLYAGDAEYKLSHYDKAGVWFARAIAINPDLETAHRYWGDTLMKAGKPELAREQYLLAFIASPYERAPRLALNGYANATHAHYAPPPITLPQFSITGKDGKFNLNLQPPDPKDPMAAVWMVYSLNSAAWHATKFHQTYPNAPEYRHTLAEEVDGLKVTLKSLRERNIPESDYSPGIRALLALEADNMIECWVLLDAPDNGTAQDYAAYRAAHRDLLRAYIEKYDLHPA